MGLTRHRRPSLLWLVPILRRCHKDSTTRRGGLAGQEKAGREARPKLRSSNAVGQSSISPPLQVKYTHLPSSLIRTSVYLPWSVSRSPSLSSES